MAQKDTTKKGVSDAGNNAEDYVRIERDGDVNSIVENAKITRQLEAAGVDINNPMEVNLAMQKLEKGEDRQRRLQTGQFCQSRSFRQQP